MNHFEALIKQNKIKNLILFILFVIFAVLQLNDPDGKLWFSIYFIVSLICLYNTFKPVPKSILNFINYSFNVLLCISFFIIH